ncbi:MAG: hypothetical protein IPI06_00120 [Gammaproteobacteria bacterium]|nr:hypothetical protein [Gammaproteobacteria bacterium]
MPGASLSRWSLSYFAAAVVFLLAGQVLMVFGFGYPAAALRAPDTLLVVHCVTIGWLSLLMCGALFQFVPVLVVRPIYSNTLPLPALLLILAGLAALLASFLQLGGHLPVIPHCFAAASVLLGSGFGIVLWTLGRTLSAARPLNLPARFVAIGLCSVAATVTLGILFTLAFGGYTRAPFALELLGRGMPLHVIAGLGGWLTFTAIGVSHRLLSMFMLSPELDGASTQWTFRLGTLALAIVIIAGTVAVIARAGLNAVLVTAGLAGAGTLALYARDVVQLYRKRVRRVIELNSRMAGIALGHLAAAAVLTFACAVSGGFGQYGGALIFLVSFGWLSGLGLAKLYKVVAFITWLECYGPVLGKTPTPRVQDLVVEPRARTWFWLYFAAVDVGTVCLLARAPLVFRAAAAGMLLASAGIALELIRTRRLANVSPALRLPQGTRLPRLLFTFVAN